MAKHKQPRQLTEVAAEIDQTLRRLNGLKAEAATLLDQLVPATLMAAAPQLESAGVPADSWVRQRKRLSAAKEELRRQRLRDAWVRRRERKNATPAPAMPPLGQDASR
jgi:hypothetical protein